jgi:ABC-type branched-subunit amino acid transport system substrate-binding protein
MNWMPLPRFSAMSLPSSPAVLSLIALGLIGAPGAFAQDQPETIRIGYLLSRAEGFGTHDRAGALMGEDEMNQQGQVVGKRFEVVFARGGHSSEVVAEARRLIEKEGVRALMGSVSDAATVALADLAQERGLVFLNVGSGVDSLREARCRRNAFSIAPSETMRVRALGLWAVQAKDWKKWAILQGDSRAEARQAETARQFLEANGGSIAGVLTVSDAEAHDADPLMERLRAMAPQFVFVALAGEKQQLVLDAFQKANLPFPSGGSEPEWTRLGRFTSEFTGYWTAGWSHLSRIFGASELNNRFVDFAGLPMNERSWAAWAGVKILGEAILRAKSPAADDLVPYLRDRLQFDGYMGTAMSFQPWSQQLRQSVLVVSVNRDSPWNGWDIAVPESSVPFRGMKGPKGDPLDALSPAAEASGCKF